MSDVSRRDAVRLAAGLAVSASMLGTPNARGQEPKKGADPQPAKKSEDDELKLARQSRGLYMFSEQVTFKTTPTEPYSFHLIITSARDEHCKSEMVNVRQGTIQIFRADPDKDDFTKKGGVYWICGKAEGKFQFKQPGALVTVVRDLDGTVRCYSMLPDLRC